MRINKFLAQCGVAGRRACDKLVAEGRVTVNGRIADLGADVAEGDSVKVDGKPVSVKKNEYYILHKPKGYLCTVSDDKGRKTVLDILGDGVGRVYPVGRLDYDSEGLLILPKTYVAKVEGRLTEADLNPIRSGIEIEGGYVTKKCRAHIVETNRDYTKVELTLREGKNREIRKMFAAIGREVILLKRTKVGELTLRGLERGAFRKLSPAEVNYLKSI